MKRNKYQIKTKKVLFFLLAFFALNSAWAGDKIVGLLYYDQSPVEIQLEDGKIQEVVRLGKLPEGAPAVYIAPGFIDNQVNGFAGISFSFGGSDLTFASVEKATQELWKKGVTTYLPTLTTNDHELLIKNLKILAKASDDPKLLGSIPGFHMEGPYINPEDGYRGAHPKKFVELPDWKRFTELTEAADNKILQVTLAPELEGGLDFVSQCSRAGIVVALGHHNAPADVVTAAVDRGAKIATHLGNGAANMINRHRNPFWSQLADQRFMISIICDGFHLLPEEIQTFYLTKGVDRTIITSDVTSYAALDPGIYKTQTGETIELTEEGMLRYPAQNVLYGSASAMTKGVGHIMEVTGCTLAQAVQMASTNPAKLYGLNDRGVLEPGKRADLIVFSLNDYRIDIQKTYVEGQLVYEQK
ncbi:N-acetylglucosamine-6-phosphate deacetylase [Sunxiuqinia rutila]|uniref:N-acetylglucosamine-6-phosphate deacetylase n=1 Tax=Sunxiuqinia rutila TaxID=1397841 RepID=UPI003D367979